MDVVNNIVNDNNNIIDNIVEFDNNIDDVDNETSQSLLWRFTIILIMLTILLMLKNIVQFDNNIDDSYDGPTQSLQKEGISGADVKEQLWDSPFFNLDQDTPLSFL